MKNIVQYKTACGSSPVKLDEEVKKLIEEGFQPYGDPHTSGVRLKGVVSDFEMYQCMVKLKQASDMQRED